MAESAETPPFQEVFFPLHLRVDAEVRGSKLNYAFETAAAIYARPAVTSEITQAVKKASDGWQKTDRSALNWRIFEIVIEALVADLKANGARYAEKPEDPQNPVPGLESGQKAKNKAIIDKLIAGSRAELQENLLVKENAAPPK